MPAKPASKYAFKPTEAPAVKGGPGRKPNPEMLELIASLEPLPLVDRENRQEGWFELDVPDVSTFRSLLGTAGAKMGVSFQSRTDVTVTDDDQLNPGVVKFRKVKRSTRERKPKA